MKIVKESLNEIKQNKTNALGAIGIGNSAMVKLWADQNFDEYTIKDGVIYPADPNDYPSEKFIKSGKIPNYVKVLALKPFELLEIGDVVTDFSGIPEDYYVYKKIPHQSKNLQKIIDNFYGDGVYGYQFKQYFDMNINAVICKKYSDIVWPEEYKTLKLYDYHNGVIGTFIYNGDKI